MKIIITSTGESLKTKFDLRFGRASWFCVYDTETKSTKFIENKSKKEKSGAGTKAAEQAAELEISSVVSGHFGPKAQSLLEQFKIRMIMISEKEKTVQEIINKMNLN